MFSQGQHHEVRMSSRFKVTQENTILALERDFTHQTTKKLLTEVLKCTLPVDLILIQE
jgi:hypothetical protein